MLKKSFLFLVALSVFAALPVLGQNPPASQPDPLAAFNLDHSITTLGDVLSDNLSSSNCLGLPVQVGDTTLIPVVSKCFGFGLGGGMLVQEEAVGRDRDNKESNKDRKGLGAGGGGAVKTVAIISIRKDGNMQIFRIQENFLAQFAREISPVLRKWITDHFDFRKLVHSKSAGENHPGNPPPPAPGK